MVGKSVSFDLSRVTLDMPCPTECKDVRKELYQQALATIIIVGAILGALASFSFAQESGAEYKELAITTAGGALIGGLAMRVVIAVNFKM